MKPPHSVAREISYASSASTRAGRAVIRSVENLTGRLQPDPHGPRLRPRRRPGPRLLAGDGRPLRPRPRGHRRQPRRHPQVRPARRDRQPPLRHPRRPGARPHPGADPRRLPHPRPSRLPQGARSSSASSCRSASTRPATPRRVNLATRQAALDYLAAGGCIGIFPGGTVSTALKPFGRPMDPSWRRFTARLIGKSGAAVVPVFFEGHNSRLFQIASHLHQTLRLALLVNEFKARVGAPVRVVIGRPLDPAEIAAARRRRPRPDGLPARPRPTGSRRRRSPTSATASSSRTSARTMPIGVFDSGLGGLTILARPHPGAARARTSSTSATTPTPPTA